MHSESPTPRTTRVLRARRGAVVAATALAGAALISACGSSSTSSTGGATTNVNTAQVAASIEQTLLEKRHAKSKVVCPAVVPAEVGKTFECIATEQRGNTERKNPFVVTVQTSRGYVTYKGK